MQNNVKINILIINMIIFEQMNILIQKKLILQKILYNIKIFHRNCLIVCYYQYQYYDHIIKICKFIQKCKFCAKTNYKNNQYSIKNEEKFCCCSNCNKIH